MLLTPVRQKHPQPRVHDVPGEVRRQWARVLPGRVRKGGRVAVAVGSRGIANLAAIVRATLDYLRDQGADPFVVAAMGSHGGATPEGQRQLLGEYGISEPALGVPVKTDMDSVQIGTNSWGEPVWWDRNALAADAVVTVSRVELHWKAHDTVVRFLALPNPRAVRERHERVLVGRAGEGAARHPCAMRLELGCIPHPNQVQNRGRHVKVVSRRVLVLAQALALVVRQHFVACPEPPRHAYL